VTATQRRRAERHQVPFRAEGGPKRQPRRASDANQGAGSIVAAVEPRTARTVGDTAARLARELNAPLVFVAVRPPLADRRDPHSERRLTRGLFRAQKALDAALAAASRHGVMSTGEILVGDAAARIADFAIARQARLVVIGQASP
jgi:nucleotide-binding universal stress UspA family protein